MTRGWLAAIIIPTLLWVGPAWAQESPAQLQAGLAGRWSGALGYRDYQNNKLYELPVKTFIRVLADGVSVIREAVFDDGPKTGPVFITTASLFNPEANTVTSASLRKGRPVEAFTETTRITVFQDAGHWTIIYERNGDDGDSPALIRVTETRNGDSLTSVKEVKPLSDPAAAWSFRNQTTLQRIVAP